MVISRVNGVASEFQALAFSNYFLSSLFFSVVGRGNVVSVPPNVGPPAAALFAKMGAFCGVAKGFREKIWETC